MSGAPKTGRPRSVGGASLALSVVAWLSGLTALAGLTLGASRQFVLVSAGLYALLMTAAVLLDRRWPVPLPVGRYLHRYERGLLIPRRGEPAVLRWDEVLTYTAHESPGSTGGPHGGQVPASCCVRLRSHDGRETGFLGGQDAFVLHAVVREEAVRHRFPAAHRAVDEGRSVSFGPVTVDREGITLADAAGVPLGSRRMTRLFPRGRLAWHRLQRVQYRDGILLIVLDTRTAWTERGVRGHLRDEDVPDLAVLLELVRAYVTPGTVRP
ncbi:hypothetical protein [Streptomyces sp. NPDC056144]|uniref:hypothetical protein n=1 Tax=unclassified Streptomyces TaxID=2593676 RepID=UPI0035D773FC